MPYSLTVLSLTFPLPIRLTTTLRPCLLSNRLTASCLILRCVFAALFNHLIAPCSARAVSRSLTAPQLHRLTVPQTSSLLYCLPSPQLHGSLQCPTTSLLHRSTAPQPHCLAAPQPHCSTAPLPHSLTAPSLHCLTAPQAHWSTAPLHHSITVLNLTAPLPCCYSALLDHHCSRINTFCFYSLLLNFGKARLNFQEIRYFFAKNFSFFVS
jgi:hypothetical protein